MDKVMHREETWMKLLVYVSLLAVCVGFVLKFVPKETNHFSASGIPFEIDYPKEVTPIVLSGVQGVRFGEDLLVTVAPHTVSLEEDIRAQHGIGYRFVGTTTIAGFIAATYRQVIDSQAHLDTQRYVVFFATDQRDYELTVGSEKGEKMLSSFRPVLP